MTEGRDTGKRPGFARTAAVVGAYAVAMAYLEAAVVVYLQTALNAKVGAVFPLLPADQTGWPDRDRGRPRGGDDRR